jgi:hypothetical protein
LSADHLCQYVENLALALLKDLLAHGRFGLALDRSDRHDCFESCHNSELIDRLDEGSDALRMC